MWWSPKTFEEKTTGDGLVLGLALSEIQLYFPFVVFHPTVLPSGFMLDAISFRPEVPPNQLSEIKTGEKVLPEAEANTSVRMTAKSDTGKLSIKQFLYDWLPPAYDHPSLWRSDRRWRPWVCLGATSPGRARASSRCGPRPAPETARCSREAVVRLTGHADQPFSFHAWRQGQRSVLWDDAPV